MCLGLNELTEEMAAAVIVLSEAGVMGSSGEWPSEGVQQIPLRDSPPAFMSSAAGELGRGEHGAGILQIGRAHV